MNAKKLPSLQWLTATILTIMSEICKTNEKSSRISGGNDCRHLRQTIMARLRNYPGMGIKSSLYYQISMIQSYLLKQVEGIAKFVIDHTKLWERLESLTFIFQKRPPLGINLVRRTSKGRMKTPTVMPEEPKFARFFG